MSKEDPRPKVFISHIHEEAGLGTVVKDGLEDAFANRIAVFVSSDRRDNPGGERWQDKIERELKDPQTRLLVSLVSPASVGEPWISIELGAAWILGRAVFPLCHSGQDPGALRRPLGDFGGASLVAEDAAHRLILSVEKATGLQAPKLWPRDKFLAGMRHAAGQAVAVAAAAAPAAAGGDLPPEQVAILQFLATIQNQGIQDVEAADAPGHCQMKPAVFSHHIHQLDDKNLAHIDWYGNGAHYRLTPDGAGWLIANDKMP